MLVYQSRNSPGWGRVQPQAFGFGAAQDRTRAPREVAVAIPAADVVDLNDAEPTSAPTVTASIAALPR